MPGVLSVAVGNRDDSAQLAVALNDINRQPRFAWTIWTGGQVLFESGIWAGDLNPANFGHACRNISSANDPFAPPLLHNFGGIAVFQDSKDDEYSDNWAEHGLGFYL